MIQPDLPVNKLYYSIGEVAAMFKVNTSLIRFWEKEFDVLCPAKNKKGNRLFTRQDIENLSRIYHLVKEKGYTLQGAREYMKTHAKAGKTPNPVLDKLLIIRKKVLELKAKLDSSGKQ